MPFPLLVPVAALGLALAGSVGFAIGTRTCAGRNGLTFPDRGWSVIVEPEDGAWSWRATKEGAAPGEGVSTSKIEAVDSARAWITANQVALPGQPNKTPPLPVLPPRVPVPTPLGGAFPRAMPVPRPMPAPPSKDFVLASNGVRWTESTNSVLLEDLQKFVQAAYDASDPFSTPPEKIVVEAIAAALPDLDFATYGPSLTIVTAQGNLLSVGEAAKLVDELQFQLNSPDLPSDALPFASDLVHEGVFNIEQKQSESPFAFRGRILLARSVPGGFISTIIDEGMVHNGDLVVPSVPDAIQLGIKTIIEKDGVA